MSAVDIALVGRPNVGKSTIFNRLIGKRRALVADEPHVTRDRIVGEARLGGAVRRICDTGGLLEAPEGVLLQYVVAQTRTAIAEASLIFFIVDGDAGLHPLDGALAQTLRIAGKRVAVLVNKVDVPTHVGRTADFFRLGFEDVLPVSGEHGRGFDEVAEYVQRILPAPQAAAESEVDANPATLPDSTAVIAASSQSEWQGGRIAVAVVGRPNAGKSSVINRLLGTQRLLACDIPGVTRDAIDSEVDLEGQPLLLIDTAGVRRRRSITDAVEHLCVNQTFDSIDRSDVTLMLLDGTLPPSEQDSRLAKLIHDKGRALIFVASKWDLVENPEWYPAYKKALAMAMPFAMYAPLLRVSAKTGSGLPKLRAAIVAAQHERHRRVTTGELNRLIAAAVARHAPPFRGGKRPRILFASQPLVCPPTFVFSTQHAAQMHFAYVRYLQNALRHAYGFAATPIWLKFRNRSKARPAKQAAQ